MSQESLKTCFKGMISQNPFDQHFQEQQAQAEPLTDEQQTALEKQLARVRETALFNCPK